MRTGNKRSDEFKTEEGLRQGGVLSVFNILLDLKEINSIDKEITSSA